MMTQSYGWNLQRLQHSRINNNWMLRVRSVRVRGVTSPKKWGYHFPSSSFASSPPFPSLPSFPPSLPFRSRPILELGGGSGSISSPSGVWAEPRPPTHCAQFQFKRWPLVALKWGCSTTHFRKWGGGTRTPRTPLK